MPKRSGAFNLAQAHVKRACDEAFMNGYCSALVQVEMAVYSDDLPKVLAKLMAPLREDADV
jgi:hypothetical protein